MEHGRRFPKAVRYSVQMEYSRPLGWISRTPEGKFVLDDGFTHRGPITSSQGSLHGSLQSRSSDHSIISVLQSHSRHPWWKQHGTKATSSEWKERPSQIHTIYEPKDAKYRMRTSSPGPIARLQPLQIEDVSSVLQPSSVERSFPSTVSSHFTPSHLHSPSYELPSLRILREQLPYICEEYEPYQHYVHPTARHQQQQQVKAEIHPEPKLGYYIHSPPLPPQMPSRYLHHPLHPAPSTLPAPYDRERNLLKVTDHLHPVEFVRYEPSPHHPLPNPHPYSQYIPPRDALMREPSRALIRHADMLHPMSPDDIPESVLTLPFRDMERQRPLATSSPPQAERHQTHTLAPPRNGMGRESESSSEDRPVAYTRDRLHKAIGRVRSGVLRTERPFRHSAPELVRGQTSYSPATTTSTTEEEQVPVTSVNGRTSVTSASSGHGSKHSRGDSLQGDLEYSPSSSSGFASRNTSQSQPSPHAVVGAPVSIRSVPPAHTLPQPDLPHLRIHPLDISVDENYEFDSISPRESSLLEQLRQYGHSWPSDPGMSDSELYTNLYPRPKKPSKYDNIEIERRIPVLKEEFQQFRRRQRDRRRSEELESEC